MSCGRKVRDRKKTVSYESPPGLLCASNTFRALSQLQHGMSGAAPWKLQRWSLGEATPPRNQIASSSLGLVYLQSHEFRREYGTIAAPPGRMMPMTMAAFQTGRAWSGKDTQARSFKVMVAIWQYIALALSLRLHGPAVAVHWEAQPYCLRCEWVAPGSQGKFPLRNSGSNTLPDRTPSAQMAKRGWPAIAASTAARKKQFPIIHHPSGRRRHEEHQDLENS